MAKISQKLVIASAISGLIGGGIVSVSGFALLNHGLFSKKKVDEFTSSNRKELTPKTISGSTSAEKVYDNVKDSVVSVLNQQNFSLDELGKSGEGQEPETAGSGSGVIYKTTGGSAYIVTNNHVVEGATKLMVVLYGGTSVPGELVGRDPMTDLAVIKISSEKVKAVAEFGDSDKNKVGESVLAIGSPLGDEFASSVTQGIISANKRIVSNIDEDGKDNGSSIAIQTDAAINPGNSGGALVNMSGQIIGITSQKLIQSESGAQLEGMGFAIPSNTVVNIVNKLVRDGEIVRPSLGVALADLVDITASEREEKLNIPNKVKSGLVIASFTTNKSPAKKAGLSQYDVITKINGKKVTNLVELREELYKNNIGDTITVTFYHHDDEKTKKVKLTEKLD